MFNSISIGSGDEPIRIGKSSLAKSCISKPTMEEPVHPVPYRLSYVQAVLMATVLEDTILQYRVNMNTNNEWRVTQALSKYRKLEAMKHGVAQPQTTDELADIDPHRLDCETYKLDKLFADRFFLRDVLDKTYMDLCVHHSYSELVKSLKTLEETMDRRAFVLQDEAKNRLLRRDLYRQLRQLRNHIKSAIYDADCTISDLRKNVEDAAMHAEIRGRYVTNWQVSREEQNIQGIADKEATVCVNIEYYKKRFDHEMRVHTEIELLTNIMFSEILQNIDKWMTKYDTDMECIDLKIQKMRINHTAQLEKREELEDTVASHEKEMRDWQKFKTDRENARLYQEKMQNAAIVVQAWWRGFLVRNQLGPYKPQTKKKGPQAKKKK